MNDEAYDFISVAFATQNFESRFEAITLRSRMYSRFILLPPSIYFYSYATYLTHIDVEKFSTNVREVEVYSLTYVPPVIEWEA